MKNPNTSKKKRRSPRVRMTRLMLERMKQIHIEIYSLKYPNSPSLALMFNVDEKTIDRDIEMMRDRMNLPIETDRQKGGYYYDGAVAAFPDVLLTEAELISMMFAVNALRSTVFAKMGEGSVKLFTKLTGALPEHLCASLADWEDAVSFHYFGEPKFNPDHFQALVSAIARREQVKVFYSTPQAKPAARVMDPLRMAFINWEWILFAFDHKHEEIRRFIPPRMRWVKKNGKTFKRPAGFRIADHLKHSFGVYSSDKIYNVVIRFDKRKAHETRERHWPKGHRLEPLPDGSVNLHVKLSHLHDINEFLLRSGGDIYPVEPVELREMYASATKKMQERVAAWENGCADEECGRSPLIQAENGI